MGISILTGAPQLHQTRQLELAPLVRQNLPKVLLLPVLSNNRSPATCRAYVAEQEFITPLLS